MSEHCYAILGKAVVDFTAVENKFREVGAYIDELITKDDDEAFIETISEMWFKLSHLQSEVEVFKNDISTFIQNSANKHEEKAEEQA